MHFKLTCPLKLGNSVLQTNYFHPLDIVIIKDAGYRLSTYVAISYQGFYSKNGYVKIKLKFVRKFVQVHGTIFFSTCLPLPSVLHVCA